MCRLIFQQVGYLLNLTQAFLDYLKKEKNYSEHTIRNYKSDLEQFFHYLDEEKVDLIDKNIVSQYIGFLMRYGFDSRSAARKLSAIKTFFKSLKRLGLIEHNPIIGIKTPKIKNIYQVFLHMNK